MGGLRSKGLSYTISMPDQDDDRLRKEALAKFHEASLKGAGAELERREGAKKRRQEMAEEEKKHAESEAQAEAAHVLEERKKKKEWQISEKKRKADIEADKKHRADEAAHIKERIEKERKLEEAQRKFFESFRERASEKAMKERMLAEKEVEYKDGIIKAENDCREKKRKIEMEESIAKNSIDHAELEGKHAIERDIHKKRDLLFREEQQKKLLLDPIRSQGEAIWRAKVQELQNVYQKKRIELDIEERTAGEFHRQKMNKEKKDLEKKTEDRRAQADNEYRDKKADLLRKIDRLKYGLPKDDEE